MIYMLFQWNMLTHSFSLLVFFVKDLTLVTFYENMELNLYMMIDKGPHIPSLER